MAYMKNECQGGVINLLIVISFMNTYKMEKNTLMNNYSDELERRVDELEHKLKKEYESQDELSKSHSETISQLDLYKHTVKALMSAVSTLAVNNIKYHETKDDYEDDLKESFISFMTLENIQWIKCVNWFVEIKNEHHVWRLRPDLLEKYNSIIDNIFMNCSDLIDPSTNKVFSEEIKKMKVSANVIRREIRLSCGSSIKECLTKEEWDQYD
jgi:hypothetical protein